MPLELTPVHCRCIFTRATLCWHGYWLWTFFRVRQCLSVCLSVTSRYSVKRDERINLILAWRLFSTSPTLCFKEIQVSINSGLTKFRHGISFVERAINSARERLTLRTSDKLDSRWSVKLIVPRSSDAGPL